MPQDDDLSEALRQEISLVLECLLLAWDPEALEIDRDPVPAGRRGDRDRGRDLPGRLPYGHGAAVNRSAYRVRPCCFEIPIERPSAHDLIAATESTRALLAEIAHSRPWESDPWFGRRTNVPACDAPALLASLARRLA